MHLQLQLALLYLVSDIGVGAIRIKYTDSMASSSSKASFAAKRLASLADLDEIQTGEPMNLETDSGGDCMGVTSSTTSTHKRCRVGNLVYPGPVGPAEVAQGLKFMVESLSLDERNLLKLLFTKEIFVSSCCSGMLFGPNGFAQAQHAVMDEDWTDLSRDTKGICVYEACEKDHTCQAVICRTKAPVRPKHLFCDFKERFTSEIVGGLNDIVAKYRSQLENQMHPNSDGDINTSKAEVATMLDCLQRELTQEIFEFLKDKTPKEFCDKGECLLHPESECSYWDVDLCQVAANQSITCSETGLECDDYSSMGSMFKALGKTKK